jgi:citronellol/citronellal dehydrogenase
MTLKGKTLFVTGASRGIGHAIALRAAKDGANVVIAAKTAEEHPKLPGTIYSAAKDMEAAGGQALPVVCDIRFEEQVLEAVEKAVKQFGGIDICINDLMNQVNARGTFMVSKATIPHLKKSSNPHILTLSPPLNMHKRWFKNHVAYTMAKYGMSMCTLGMSAELVGDGIAVNSLWPETAIATAAVANLLGGEKAIQGARTAEIMADAAYVILNRNSKECTGNFFIDTEILQSEGVTDFEKYAVSPGTALLRDFFIDRWVTGVEEKSTSASS